MTAVAGEAPGTGPVGPSTWHTEGAEVTFGAYRSIQGPAWEAILTARAEAEAEA